MEYCSILQKAKDHYLEIENGYYPIDYDKLDRSLFKTGISSARKEELITLLNLHFEGLRRLAGVSLPKYAVGYWIREAPTISLQPITVTINPNNAPAYTIITPSSGLTYRKGSNSNRGVIIEYCGYYEPGEWDEKYAHIPYRDERYPNFRAAMHRGISGHIYRVERHLENWNQEFRDYYCTESFIEPDV